MAIFETANATHNRAGEITYQHAPLSGQPLRYLFRVFTYTRTDDPQSLLADRDSLDIFWGDGNTSKILRVNGPVGSNGIPSGENLPGGNTRLNIYEAYHTYPGAFPQYVVSVRDPNRIESIININFGESVNIPFFIEDTLFVLNPQFFGYNNSPILYQPPIDYGQIGEIFIHNPNAFDIDGDSLYFQIIPPKKSLGTDVENYRYPNEVTPGPDNQISIHPNNGELIWNSPQEVGIYNIAILIQEFRNGVKIGSMTRDMQITIVDTDNRPPEISSLQDTCVFLGDVLEINVHATDPDSPSQFITLTAYGGPLELAEQNSPAIFTANNNFGSADGIFRWETNCDHIYSTDYIVVFKAEDSYIYNGVPIPLVDLETWLIHVVAPPPQNVMAEVQGENVIVSWENPYTCADSEKFLGFEVWRKPNCDPDAFDNCTEGLDNSYTLLADNVTDYQYTDATAIHGLTYTYRIVARFADVQTSSNFPINISKSVASEGVCVDLPQNIPIILEVSVQATDAANGQMRISWSKPNFEDLDTLVNKPPYTYEIQRAEGLNGQNFVTLQSFTANYYSTANDTVLLDNGLDTQNKAYTYKINFYVNNGTLLGSTEAASSIFITISPTDNQLNLSWEEFVPWENYEYAIFRASDGQPFDSIASAAIPYYEDKMLTNGKTYCYYVKAKGSYYSEGLPSPLINLSQENCAVPIDNIPPCAPILSVANDCDEENPEEISETYNQNRLSWILGNISCVEDIVSYNIYFSPPEDSAFALLQNVVGVNNTSFAHTLTGSLAACYYITAIDSVGNESVFSNEICKESCLSYNLPNTFTPNSDQMNDLFVPRENRFVSSVDFKVYNRWGNLVFETQEPALNWDGTDFKSGKKLSEGVYYYTCDVLERNSQGIEIVGKSLSGYIHLFSNSN
ncbi:MAG: gliding motility-associated C-terminal domain-containing protein [Chitinophagales bacterium]|nr:gliding motility-associated C-terminal domain-containing protein [Bacteroidota bacterium]MCB9042662.1 gliding motility-associated C-terminal domain-containing protein [Chitinophagales bacterium]